MARAALGPARLHLGLGRLLSLGGWDAGVLRACADALRVDPELGEAHFRMGEAFARRRLWLEASRAFGEAARLAPASVEVQGNLLLALWRAGRREPALRSLRRLIHLRPNQAELHLLRGALLMRLRHPEEAIRAFRWAAGLELSPHWQRFFLGEALLGAREWDAVVRAYERAAAIAVVEGPPRGFDAPWRSCLNRPAVSNVRRQEPVRPAQGRTEAGEVTGLVRGAVRRAQAVLGHVLWGHGPRSTLLRLRQARRVALNCAARGLEARRPAQRAWT